MRLAASSLTADREHAEAAVTAVTEMYRAKWPKATAKITDDKGELLTFFDYPAEHWIHVRPVARAHEYDGTKGVVMT
jgi:transposase-like protein